MLITDHDLQNLAYCARQCMVNFTPDQMLMVATAIKHAEADMAEMRKPPATVTMPDAPVDAVPVPTGEAAP